MTIITVHNQDKSIVKQASNSVMAKAMKSHLSAVFNEEFEISLEGKELFDPIRFILDYEYREYVKACNEENI